MVFTCVDMYMVRTIRDPKLRATPVAFGLFLSITKYAALNGHMKAMFGLKSLILRA